MTFCSGYLFHNSTNLVLDALLGQVVSVLLLGGRSEVGGGPQVGGQETGGLGKGVVHSHGQVTSGTGVTSSGGVHVLDTSHVQELLGDQRGDNAGTTGGRDQSATHRAALAGHLAGHGVGKASVETPVSTADRDQVHLGVDDASTDSGSNLLGSLDAKSNVSIVITDSNVALEAGALTSGGLLLHRHDLHDLVLQGGAQKVVDDLVLLDGKGEKEDLLNRLDLSLLDETSELGDRDPLVLVALVSTATATTTASATATISTASATAKSSSSFSFSRHVKKLKWR